MTAPDHQGAILADEMGLGKTLTTLGLLRMLCKSVTSCVNDDPKCRKIRKGAILCPATLVGQWEKENVKFFSRISSGLTMIAALEKPGGKLDGTNATAKEQIGKWTAADGRKTCCILVVSYDTALRNAGTIFEDDQLDALVLDEGHKLKSTKSKMATIIKHSKAMKRLLISGTPAMNNLDEFWALADLVNPGVFGTLANFRSQYGAKMQRGATVDASADDTLQAEAARDLVRSKASSFYLRRTSADVDRSHLPPKTEHIVCCAMTPAQRAAYVAVIQDTDVDALAKIHCLRNIATRGVLSNESSSSSSGKLMVLRNLLTEVMRSTTDKVVVVSLSTETLDVLKGICDAGEWSTARLDGSTPVDDRTAIVTRFNSTTSNLRVFLLSSKAGGCGLNLIGANRLVLVDCDWNPASDEQAMARVWRDGQTKPVHIYRLFSTGTVDEIMLQRQLAKHDLADGVVDGADVVAHFSKADLKDIFGLDDDTSSSTATKLGWAPYDGGDSDSDDVLRKASTDHVTYVMSSTTSASSDGTTTTNNNNKRPQNNNNQRDDLKKSKTSSLPPPVDDDSDSDAIMDVTSDQDDDEFSFD